MKLKTTTEIYSDDKEWLRRLKVKNNLLGIKDIIRVLIKFIKKHKIEDELR